jgi:hypothetical protein
MVAERIGDGPVIAPGMKGLEGALGENIDGPAVIRVPDWLPNRLGRYYMYFAHHRGTYIRLAYADRPEGPWTIYAPGTLKLEETTAIHHVASPDILVDEANKRLLLYFHGPTEMPDRDYGGRPYAQSTFLATSTDGLKFRQVAADFAAPYMKVIALEGAVYGMAMADKKSAYPAWLRSARLFRSKDGLPPFEPGPRMLDEMRHGAMLLRGEMLHLFYTRVGDSPERILHAAVDTRPDWTEWTASAPEEILRPERSWEGAELAATASRGGMSAGAERALRDPAVLVDDAGTAWLYYTVAGEKGIAVARLREK